MPFSNVIRLLAPDTYRTPLMGAKALATASSASPSAPLFAANDPRPYHRFSVRDRIVAHQWITAASVCGYGRLEFARSEESDGAELCDYLLIYRRDIRWAHWGVACRVDGYEVWHATRGTTLGVYPRLCEALAQVLAYSD